MSEHQLSVSFRAMIKFIEEYWERGDKQSDDIAVLLGSIGLNEDGLPMDQALWEDYRDAYLKATKDVDVHS